MSDTKQSLHIYRFSCPECGMGDAELGHLLPADELHCVVCLIDEDRYVRLRRWLAEEHMAETVAGPPSPAIDH